MAAEDCHHGVTLLSAWPSPFGLRVRVALKIKSINYELIEEPPGSGVKSELLLKSNPVHKKIPVLFHGDKPPICESLIIVQYIDEAWTSGPRILPLDPHDCAIARFWAAYIDEKWFPSLRGILAAQGEEAKREAMEQVAEGLALLEDAYKSGHCNNGEVFFGGEKIGYLDIALGSFLAWLRVLEKMNNVMLLDEIKTPALSKWAEAFSADDAVKDFMPETDKLMAFGELLMAKSRASPQN